MSYVNIENIIGYYSNENLYCVDCANESFSDTDWENLKYDQVLVGEDEDCHRFCDNCGCLIP